MNLILSDTIIAGFGVPVDTIATFQHGWKLGRDLCLVTGFILTTTGNNSLQNRKYYEKTKKGSEATSNRNEGWRN